MGKEYETEDQMLQAGIKFVIERHREKLLTRGVQHVPECRFVEDSDNVGLKYDEKRNQATFNCSAILRFIRKLGVTADVTMCRRIAVWQYARMLWFLAKGDRSRLEDLQASENMILEPDGKVAQEWHDILKKLEGG